MLLLNCAVCSNKNSRFINEQEARRLLSSLGIRTHSFSSTKVGHLRFYIKFSCVKLS